MSWSSIHKRPYYEISRLYFFQHSRLVSSSSNFRLLAVALRNFASCLFYFFSEWYFQLILTITCQTSVGIYYFILGEIRISSDTLLKDRWSSTCVNIFIYHRHFHFNLLSDLKNNSRYEMAAELRIRVESILFRSMYFRGYSYLK